MRKFLNLSNGLLWHSELGEAAGFVRIESTRLEAKDFGGVLTRLGAEFFVALTEGEVAVYDASEKRVTTRAIWQGLPWIGVACSLAWDLPMPDWVMVRTTNCIRYLTRQWMRLPVGVRRTVGYFQKFVRVDRIQLLGVSRNVHDTAIEEITDWADGSLGKLNTALPIG